MPDAWATANRLATGESDQIGALRYEAFQILGRWKLTGGIDDYRDAMAARESGELPQARFGMRLRDPQDRCSLAIYGRLVLPKLGVAHTGAREAIGNAHLDQFGACLGNRVVVHIALAAGHDDLVRHARRLRQQVHFGRIESGKTGRGGQHERGGRPGGHISRLGPGDLGQDFTGAPLQFGEIDAPLRSLGHCPCHLGAHDPATEPRGRARGVDDRSNSEALIDVFVRTGLK